MERLDKEYLEKIEFYKKEVEQTIEDFWDGLADFAYALDIKTYDESEEKMEKSKKKLERILEKNNLSKEEKYFIYGELNLKELFQEYHKGSLQLLGDALKGLYLYGTSELSRCLDNADWLTKVLEVPNFEYIDKVLENTPKEALQKELNDQLEEKKISNQEINFLLEKYNLKYPGDISLTKKEQIKKEYSEHSKSNLIKRLFGIH